MSDAKELDNPQPIEEAEDDAIWDEFFANSRDMLTQMSDEAHEQYLAGLTEDFDPDTDMP